MRAPSVYSVALIGVLLMLPAASAGFTWFAPSSGYTGQPVTAAYAFVAGDSPVALTGHQNVQIQVVAPDGTITIDSTSVHEHDGFYSFMFTPEQPGPYTLMATSNEEEHRASIDVAASLPDDDLQRQFDGLELLVEEEGAGHRIQAAYPQDAPVHMTPGLLVDLYDQRGLQVLSLWQDPSMPVRVASAYGPFIPTAIVAGPDHQQYDDHGFGLRLLQTPEVAGAGDDDLGLPTVPALLPMEDACDESGIPLFVDPGSQSQAGDAWQTDTDIRVAVVDLQPAAGQARLSPIVAYSLHARTADAPELFEAVSADAFGQMTFRVRDPGSYFLRTTLVGDGSSCTFSFDIDDGPATGGPDDAAPADLDHDVLVDGDSAIVHLAVVQPDGSMTGHYEFDTRVYRANGAGPDGALVWKGKLHGHASEVSLALGGLPPGQYGVRVFPSPQSGADLAAVAPDSDGFVFGFQVDEMVVDEAAVETPAAGLAAGLAALAAALARRRG